MKTNKKTHILLVLIIAVGFFLRIVNINHTPPGIYPDEAVNGIDAMNALHYGQWQWFYEANNGREGLFMNLIAFCFKLWGVSPLTLKLPAIICGTLTIWGTFLLAKELFRKNRIALVASFLVATSFWAMNFSRISFRANMLPFVLAFCFYFLFKGLRTRNYRDFIFGGMFFGLGMHTYIAFRIAPLILVVMVITLIISRRRFIQEYWKHIFAFVILATMVAAPMLYTFYRHPEYISSRTGNVSILNPEINQGHLVMTFLKSFGLSIIKYNIWGDQNWRHNYPPYAILDPVTGIAFTFGFAYSVLRLIHLFYLRFRRKIRHERLEVYMFLAASFFIMLVPEFMTAEGNPHALRSIGTLPMVFIFSALTFEYFIRKSEFYTPMFKKIVASITVFTLLVIGVFNSVKYHYVWANQRKVAESFDSNIKAVSDYVGTLPADQETYVVTESMQRIPIQLFNWGRPNINYVYPGQITDLNPQSKNFEIILTDYSDDIVNYLQNRFPEIRNSEIKDRFGLTYYIMK